MRNLWQHLHSRGKTGFGVRLVLFKFQLPFLLSVRLEQVNLSPQPPFPSLYNRVFHIYLLEVL